MNTDRALLSGEPSWRSLYLHSPGPKSCSTMCKYETLQATLRILHTALRCPRRSCFLKFLRWSSLARVCPISRSRGAVTRLRVDSYRQYSCPLPLRSWNTLASKSSTQEVFRHVCGDVGRLVPGQHGRLARMLGGKLHHPVHHEYIRKGRILFHFRNLHDNRMADARFRPTAPGADSLCAAPTHPDSIL